MLYALHSESKVCRPARPLLFRQRRVSTISFCKRLDIKPVSFRIQHSNVEAGVNG